MADRIIATLIIIFSACYIVATIRLPQPPFSSTIGPRDFPLFVGICLALASTALFVKPFKKTYKKKILIENKSNIIFVTIATIGYVCVLQFTGYIISTFLFLIIVLFVLNKGKVYQNLSIAILSPTVAYILIKALQITLKEGIFGLP